MPLLRTANGNGMCAFGAPSNGATYSSPLPPSLASLRRGANGYGYGYGKNPRMKSSGVPSKTASARNSVPCWLPHE